MKRQEKYDQLIKKLKVNEEQMTQEQLVKYAAALNRLRDEITKEMCDIITELCVASYQKDKNYYKRYEQFVKDNTKLFKYVINEAMNSYKTYEELVMLIIKSGLLELTEKEVSEPIFMSFIQKQDDGVLYNPLLNGVWNPELKCWTTPQGMYYNYKIG